jgi:hypothetical protein
MIDPLWAYVAVLIAAVIPYLLWLNRQADIAREQARRDWLDAQARHLPSKDKYRRFVQATCKQLETTRSLRSLSSEVSSRSES